MVLYEKKGTMHISEDESNIISLVRVFATFLIVMCHYIVIYSKVAWLSMVFNVGVELFFIISGFLYGQKKIIGVRKWLIKQIYKIAVPIYLYYLISGILLCAMRQLGDINLIGVIKQLLFLNGFIGGGIGNIATSHLWFMSYILLCYAITPILQILRGKLRFGINMLIAVIAAVLEIVFILTIELNNQTAYLVHLSGVVLYIFSYFFSCYWNREINKPCYILLCALMLIANIFRIVTNTYIDNNTAPLLFKIYFSVISAYSQCIFAMWIFMTIHIAYYAKKEIYFKIKKYIIFWDRRSMYMYIVHEMFIFAGVFNVTNWTQSYIIKSIVFIACSLLFCEILYVSSNRIYNIPTDNKKSKRV